MNKILAIVNTLPENSVIVDAGANIGLVSIPIAQLVAPNNGTVYAFEAQRMMAYALCGGAALNDLENLIVKNQALGSKARTLNAQLPDYSQAQDFGLFSPLQQQAQTPTDTIEVISIDSLALPRFDFFKIDVEGMEIEVLQGAQQSIQQHQPWCWVEYWKTDIEQIKAQFTGLEYRFYVMDKLNMLCAPLSRLNTSSVTINAKEM